MSVKVSLSTKGVTALDICLETGVLVAGSEDGKMIIWDLKEFEVIQTLVSHTGDLYTFKQYLFKTCSV